MRKNYLYPSFFIGLASFSGCSSLYMPNVPATPMLRESGEVYVAAHSSMKGNLSANAAVAISPHVALLANGSYREHAKESARQELFDQKMVEGGIGYFTKVGKAKKQLFEVYAGYGLGRSRQDDRRAGLRGMETQELREMDFDKIFVQVNYSSTKQDRVQLFGKKRTISYGTAIRFSRVAMQDFKINQIEQTKEEAYFAEPLFFTRLELNKGLQLQYTNGFNVNLLSNEYLKAGNAVFTLGLAYNFYRKKK